MKQGRTLQELAIELDRQNKLKRDYVADTRSMMVEPGETGVSLIVGGANGSQLTRGPVTDLAHGQIADHVGVPKKYYDRMLAESPELLARNVNHWFAAEPKRRMVRTLDGRTRAFLSDRYQRIDNYDVAQVALPVLMEEAEKAGLEIASCEVTDRKLYLKATTPRIAGEVSKGDVVQAGVMITNSEVGCGAFSVSPLVYRLVCLNGLVIPDGRFRKYHVGGRIEGGDGLAELISDEAKAADDRAVLLKARDVIRAALDQAVFDGYLAKMRDSMEDKVTGNPIRAVEVLGETVGLTQGEQDDVIKHLINGGDVSRWGLLNAVTRAAQDVSSYDRSTDLEEIGGRILNLPRTQWREIAKAA